MTDFVKVLRETPLAKGGHSVHDGKACVMEKVAILWALATGQDVSDVYSDMPECTNQVIARTAQYVNDRLRDFDRQQLNSLIPRLLRARRTPSDQRINARLAIWAARRLLASMAPEGQLPIEPRDRKMYDLCERAIEAAEAWLANPDATTTATAFESAEDAYRFAAFEASQAPAGLRSSLNVAACITAVGGTAASNAAYATSTASNAAYATTTAASNATVDLISFLDELLDQWEEAVTKEGEDLYIPQAWEDDALAFAAEIACQ